MFASIVTNNQNRGWSYTAFGQFQMNLMFLTAIKLLTESTPIKTVPLMDFVTSGCLARLS
jgi:hypothetical protein